MSDCIFCGILAGELPGSFVFRDERCAAFMDIQPVNSGHVLIVPLSHAGQLSALDAPTAAHLMVVAQRITAALRASPIRCEGVNLLLADGIAAGQEVSHVHLHVVPRFNADGFGFRYRAEYKNAPAREQLELTAAQIRTMLVRPVTDTA